MSQFSAVSLSANDSSPQQPGRGGFWPRFLLFPFLALAGYPLFLFRGQYFSAVVDVVWVVVMTCCWFCVSGAFHESVHQTLFRNVKANVYYGRILGWMIGIPYTAYRETHRRHHACLNTAEDYELWPYSDPRLPHRVWWTILYEYIGLVLFWATVIGGLLAVGHQQQMAWESFRWFWLLPLVLSPMANTARKFVEHLGMTSTDPMLGTRTVLSTNPLERLLSFFNFDIAVHGPHHISPRAHHYELSNRLDRYRTTHPDVLVPVFRSYVSAFADVLWCLWAAPQTGTHTVQLPAQQPATWQREEEMSVDEWKNQDGSITI